VVVFYWVLPSRCGGSLVNNYFSFRPVNNADVLVELLAIFSECGVMPMLHVPGIARYVIDRELRPRLIVRIDDLSEATLMIGDLRVIKQLIGFTTRLRCRHGTCQFRGDLALLDITRFSMRLPIVIKVRINDKSLVL